MIVYCKDCCKKIDLNDEDMKKILNTAPHNEDWLLDNFLCKKCFCDKHNGEIIKIRAKLNLNVDNQKE